MKKSILFLLVAIFSLPAWSDGVTIDGIYYHRGYQGGTSYDYYEVQSVDENLTDAVILEEVNKMPVISILSGAFSGHANLKTVSMPNSITSIEYGAFENCTNLQSITMSNSISRIERNTFEGCTSLQSVTIPNTVDQIGWLAFYNCTSLQSISIPGSVEWIYEFAFSGCSNLREVIFDYSENIIKISCKNGESAFGNCPNLQKLVINRCLERHYNTYPGIFSEVPVREIIFGPDCSVITEMEFADISTLEKINIPSTINLIMPNAFSNCTNLKNVNIEESPDPLFMVGDFGKSGIEVLNLNRQLYEGAIEVGTLGTYNCKPTFAGCSGLTSINFGEKFNTICDNMFSDCSALRSVTIPQYITKIGEGAFSGCKNLKSINIEDCEESILINSKTNADGEGSTFAIAPIETLYLGRNVEFSGTELSPFKNKTTLTTLTIGNKTTKINNYLFYGCTNIAMLSVPSSVETIGDYAFYDCNQSRSLTISKSVKSIGEYAFYNCKNLKNLTIPGSVITIGDYAFRSCSSLTNIKIGEKVETIGNYAFLDCYSAENITLGNSVKEIGNNAFYNCQAWTEIDIPNSVKSIGNDAFALCLGAKEVKIGDGVETIGLRSFTDCEGLTTLTIGESVKEIGEMAFFNCENLKDVYVAAMTPPTANESVFSDYSAKLHVPDGTSGAYKGASDDCWPLFTSIGEYTPENAVEEIWAYPSDNSITEVYDLKGLKLGNSTEGLHPGIYILRQGNSTKKIAIK